MLLMLLGGEYAMTQINCQEAALTVSTVIGAADAATALVPNPMARTVLPSKAVRLRLRL